MPADRLGFVTPGMREGQGGMKTAYLFAAGMYLVSTVCVVIGLMLLAGGWLDWGFLTDPPKQMFWCCSQSLLRVFFPRQAMRAVTALLGLVFLVGAIAMLEWHS